MAGRVVGIDVLVFQLHLILTLHLDRVFIRNAAANTFVFKRQFFWLMEMQLHHWALFFPHIDVLRVLQVFQIARVLARSIR